MNYGVSWDYGARLDPVRLAAAAPDPMAVVLAVDAAEQELATDPTRRGQHVAEGLWKLVEPPVVVYFELDLAARRVHITQVSAVP